MIVTALIGSPVDHSISPQLFKLYADEHQLEYAHTKFDIKAEDLEKVITSLCAFGFAGANITLPYKTDVMRFLDYISPEARAIGAVNTIKVNKNKLEGYNTDAYGAIMAIEKVALRNIDASDSAIVLGTGGAARAITWSLLQKGAKVTVIYREPESRRTNKMKEDFHGIVKFLTYKDVNTHILEKITLVCNATSAGMYPNINGMPDTMRVLEYVDLHDVIIFDAIFNPKITKFQEWAKERGGILAYGIDMMIYQGITAFEYWTNYKVSADTIEKAAFTLMKL
ncbi:MAG: shikimate dehydrogenase [Candidatus Gracilibacteria bacterium]